MPRVGAQDCLESLQEPFIDLLLIISSRVQFIQISFAVLQAKTATFRHPQMSTGVHLVI